MAGSFEPVGKVITSTTPEVVLAKALATPLNSPTVIPKKGLSVSLVTLMMVFGISVQPKRVFLAPLSILSAAIADTDKVPITKHIKSATIKVFFNYLTSSFSLIIDISIKKNLVQEKSCILILFFKGVVFESGFLKSTSIFCYYKAAIRSLAGGWL